MAWAIIAAGAALLCGGWFALAVISSELANADRDEADRNGGYLTTAEHSFEQDAKEIKARRQRFRHNDYSDHSDPLRWPDPAPGG